jgi:putative FmdB family regulatory protein
MFARAAGLATLSCARRANNRLANAGGAVFIPLVVIMPTYEYACTKCGHELETFQSMKDAPLKKCPACRRSALRRKVGGGAGLIFKGSGFYITDYKKKPGGKSEGGDAKPSSPSPESKPAAAKAAAN